MLFLKRRKKQKYLSELKARRHAEDDLLSPALRSRFDQVIADLENAPDDEIAAALEKSRKEYAALPLSKRNWIYGLLDLFLVVGAVAFGLRGLFFQPFRIPTGSMQPTLFGIHYQSFEKNANFLMKFPLEKVRNCLLGAVPAEATVSAPGGVITEIDNAPGKLFDGTFFIIGGKKYVLPGNPRQVIDYAGLTPEKYYAEGEKLGNGVVSLGDHLFVERFSIYLAPPDRGDVIVFNTENLFVQNEALGDSSGYYYIKRLAALPGDTVKLVNNQLWVKTPGSKTFAKIQDISEKFRKIYSQKGGYHGHLSGMGFKKFAFGEEYTIPDDHYLMLGDNSNFSMDSRYFGTVPRRNLIGRAWFVFYPFTRRMGAVDRNEPLNEKTGKPGVASFEVMSRQ